MESKPPNSLNTEHNAALITALKRILRPLVKLLITHQITFPYISNLLKSLYVEVAEQDFPVEGKKQTDSRINLLTGVHRKDVKRIRSDAPEAGKSTASISLGAQLVGHWLGDKNYQDAEGKPRPLPLRAGGQGEGPTFDDLVEKIARQDIRPRVILDELIRLGVARSEDNTVYLSTPAFAPDQGLDEKLFFFGKNIQDHICAGTHNLSGRKPAFFDRSVYYDQLSRDSIDTLTQLCNKIGMETLITINERALELQTRDSEESGSADKNTYRMNFGIFHFNTRQSDADQSDGNDE